MRQDKHDPNDKYHMVIKPCGHIQFVQYHPTHKFFVIKGDAPCERCKNAPK